MTLNANFAFTRLEDMLAQLEQSWPKTFQSILDKNPFPGAESFFIHTFTKWDFTGDTPKYNVIHHPRKSLPDPFWGTICRRVIIGKGACEIWWALPHKEGLKNYEDGKIFADEMVAKYIQAKKSGELDRFVDEYNKKHGFEENGQENQKS